MTQIPLNLTLKSVLSLKYTIFHCDSRYIPSSPLPPPRKQLSDSIASTSPIQKYGCVYTPELQRRVYRTIDQQQ